MIFKPDIIPCNSHGNELMFINGRCGKCIQLKEQEQNNILVNNIKKQIQITSGIPLRYQNATFQNYICKQPTPEQLLKQERIKQSLFNFDFDSNLCFLGKTGTGKTHLACALLNKKIQDKIFTDDELESIKRNPNFKPRIDYYYVKFYYLAHLKIKEFDNFKKIVTNKYLVIDEVGFNDTEFKNNLLFEIIDRRYDSMLYTFLISNLTPEGFKEYLSQATYSRIKESYKIFDAQWEDYRVENSNKKL